MAISQDVLDKLYATGNTSNDELMEKIRQISRKQRILDGPPEKYSEVKLDLTGIEPFGIYNDFMRRYDWLYKQAEAKDSKVVIKDTEYTCTYELLIALKTLLYLGTTRSEARAEACRDVFEDAINCAKDGELKAVDICRTLTISGGTYEAREIAQCFADLLLTVDEQVTLRCERLLDTIPKEFYGFKSMEEFEAYIDEEYAKLKDRKRGSRIVAVAKHLQTV